jgi:processive 1,2-diacylglycerol beta-glucosyltransferase
MPACFKKVLVLSASAGAGHTRAAEAIQKAFIQLEAVEAIRHVDVLDYTNKFFRDLYSKAYIEMANKAPKMLGWIYDKFDQPYKHDRIRVAFNKLNLRPFIKLLEEFKPDLMVCTHFVPSEIISWMKLKRRIRCPLAIVITDYDAHAMWLSRNAEQYFVALEETKVYLTKFGVLSSKINVTGIPIDPIFAIHKDKYTMRKKYGLHLDKMTILVSTGGFGVGPMEDIVKSLLEVKNDIQLIAICGRNPELKKRIERLAHRGRKRIPILAVGYTYDMDEYMAASDLFLGKPGGLTTSEALAKGLVPVIVNPIPGQEERNSDHLLEKGVAIRCNNLPTLAYKIDELLDDTGRFFRMQQKASHFGRPLAACDIVSKLMRLKQPTTIPRQRQLLQTIEK